MIRDWLSNDYLIYNVIAYSNSVNNSIEYTYWVSYIKNPLLLIVITEYADCISIKSIHSNSGHLIDKKYIFELSRMEFTKALFELNKY